MKFRDFIVREVETVWKQELGNADDQKERVERRAKEKKEERERMPEKDRAPWWREGIERGIASFGDKHINQHDSVISWVEQSWMHDWAELQVHRW